MDNATLYTSTNYGLRAVEVPQSLADEVKELHQTNQTNRRRAAELEKAVRAALEALESERQFSVLDARAVLRRALED